ncbi:hypothetical protein DFJ74DRAFT_707729 [Hyaloraphidium curvatum]|nr:hypothetical protein DFJ74DRAFT_707729 [Hyaloraphidium curvatum]
MAFSIRGKAALVTGGTEGIGLAAVERLLQLGARVLVANRSEAVAEKLLPELRRKHGVEEGDLVFHKMDLLDLSSIYSSFEAGVAAFGSVDIVFANAGFQIPENFFTADDKFWLDQVNGNLCGTMALGKAAANHWRETGKPASFVANASFAGLHGLFRDFQAPEWIAYAAAKGGIISFIDFMQGNAEFHAGTLGLSRSPQRFSCLAPSFVWTSIFSKAGYGANPKEAESHPLYKDVLPPYGYWTPMEATIDAFVRLVEGEDERGTCLVLCGEGGVAKEYPPVGFGAEQVISRVRPGNFSEGIAKLKDNVRQAAVAGASGNDKA